MIRWEVRNFRGCAHAIGECNPIALVAGRNGAGKSSLAQAVAAALTGEALPIDGLAKAQAGMLVRSGKSSGSVEITTDDGSVSIAWPSAAPISSGDAPRASIYSAGLQSIVDATPKERARVLSQYLHAAPTREDIEATFREHNFPAEAIEAIVKLTEEKGWDGAYEARRERGAEFKGRWRGVTGVNYGSRIAAVFRPDLADLDESILIAAVREAKIAIEQALGREAVSASERERLTTEADAFSDRETALRQATERAARAQEAYRAAQALRMELPPLERRRTVFCPHCGAEVDIQQISLVEFQLIKPRAVSVEDQKAQRLKVAEADGKLANANDELNIATSQEARAKEALERARAARDRIANWPAIESRTDIDALRNSLTRAEKLLGDFHVKQQADRIHGQIERNERILIELAPDGLRRRKLDRVLAVFRDQLRQLTDAAGWEAIEITPEMAIAYGNRPLGLLSTSERYRVRVTLQVAMAALDHMSPVVIDGVDILDGPGRSGLLRMLTTTGQPALLCMTLSRRDQMPDLARLEAAGVRAYWIEEGVLEPLGEKVEA